MKNRAVEQENPPPSFLPALQSLSSSPLAEPNTEPAGRRKMWSAEPSYGITRQGKKEGVEMKGNKLGTRTTQLIVVIKEN